MAVPTVMNVLKEEKINNYKEIRKMKKIICLTLCVSFLFIFSACCAQESENENLDVDLSVSEIDNSTSNTKLNTENSKTYVTLSEAVRYDLVTFGKYEQDNNESNGAEDIEWLVLEKTENSALLITDKIIDIKQFNVETNNDFINGTNPDWNSSDIRIWLNSDFYSTAFSADEQNKILSTNIITTNNPEYGTSGGPNTVDKVFLISSQDAEKYLESTVHLHAAVTDFALNIHRGYVNSGIMEAGTGWWLRTRGKIVTPPGCGTSTHIVEVSENKNNGIYYSGLGAWYYMGIRPAIYVKF